MANAQTPFNNKGPNDYNGPPRKRNRENDYRPAGPVVDLVENQRTSNDDAEEARKAFINTMMLTFEDMIAEMKSQFETVANKLHDSTKRYIETMTAKVNHREPSPILPAPSTSKANTNAIPKIPQKNEKETNPEEVPQRKNHDDTPSDKHLVSLKNTNPEVGFVEIIKAIHHAFQNQKDERWTLQRLGNECDLYDRKINLMVLRCTARLKLALSKMSNFRMNRNWVKIEEFIRAWHCNNCQQYGHVAPKCQQKMPTCWKCGLDGHSKYDCRSTETLCATCLKVATLADGARGHATFSADCPVRIYEEMRSKHS